MTIYSIYRATNTLNGKVYIGFTSGPVEDRMLRHQKNSLRIRNKFYNAIKKYGWNAFVWDTIYQSLDGEHTLGFMENHFITEHDSFKQGYNSTLGGEGSLGRIVSEATKDKIRGDKNPSKKPENQQKIRDGRKGQSVDMDAILRGAEKRKGRTNPEHSKKMSGSGNPMYGKKGSEHPASGRKRTDDEIEKTSGEKNGMYGRTHTEQALAKIKKKCIDPNGVVYDSLKEAAIAHDTSIQTISSRIRRGNYGWKHYDSKAPS